MSTAGNLWMAACERYLVKIWPHVGRQRRPGRNDFTGTWDIGVEATIVPWSKIWIKLRQAERDAKARGLDLACVWKKHNRAEGDRGAVDPGEGAVVMRAAAFFPMVARLEDLEAREVAADDEFTRGFTAGVAYARKHPAPTAAEEAV